MKLRLGKASALLVAGLAFAACSQDANNTPMSPTLANAIVDTPGDFVVRVCKIPIEENYGPIDDNAKGVYDFKYEYTTPEGTTEGFFSQETVDQWPTVGNDGISDCGGADEKTYGFGIPSNATSLVVTEFTKTENFGIPVDPSLEGYAKVWRIAASATGGCSFTPELVNDGSIAGRAHLDFTTGDCSAGVKLFFKNAFVPDEDDGGIEGCTPGAWKNQDGTGRNGKNRWIETGWDLSTTFESVFGAGSISDADLTLREALDLNSNRGGLALLKHAAAAALNAKHPDVDYPYSLSDVVSMFNAAWADLEADDNATKDMFDAANNLGCPI